MGNTHLQLDTRRPLSDGTCPVRVAVGHGTDLYLPTGIHLRPCDWNARAQLATGRDAAAVNRALSSVLSRAVLRCLELRERGLWGRLTRAQLRAMLLDPALESPPEERREATLADAFRLVMSRKSPHTAEQYGIAMRSVSRFRDIERTPLSKVTAGWMEDYLFHIKGLAPATRAGYMTRLKSALFAAEREGWCAAAAARRVSVRREQTRMRDLTAEELRRLRDMPLSGRDAEARDMFMLIFYLIGINAADLFALTPASVRNGRIEYRRAKTGRLYSIRVEPEAAEIIGRYRGERKLLLPFERAASPSAWGRSVLKSLKGLGVRPDLSPYFARYTWASLAAYIDIPKETISEALGHRLGSETTGIYIHFRLDKIDAANRRLLDYVAGGD